MQRQSHYVRRHSYLMIARSFGCAAFHIGRRSSPYASYASPGISYIQLITPHTLTIIMCTANHFMCAAGNIRSTICHNICTTSLILLTANHIVSTNSDTTCTETHVIYITSPIALSTTSSYQSTTKFIICTHRLSMRPPVISYVASVLHCVSLIQPSL